MQILSQTCTSHVKCSPFPKISIYARTSQFHGAYHLFKIILLIFEQLSYTYSQIKMCKLYMNMHKFQDLNAPFQTYSLNTFYLLLYLLRITHKIFIFWSMKCYEFVNNASKYFRSISLLIGAGFCNPAPARPGGKGHKCSLLPQ